MNYERCISFKYCGSSLASEIQGLTWVVEFEGGGKIIVTTRITDGVPELQYLEHLVSKGGRFVDDKDAPLMSIFSEAPLKVNKDKPNERIFSKLGLKLVNYLYSPWVVQHS